MNTNIDKDDVIAIIKSFLEVAGWDNTESVVLNIGAELLDISQDEMLELANKNDV